MMCFRKYILFLVLVSNFISGCNKETGNDAKVAYTITGFIIEDLDESGSVIYADTITVDTSVFLNSLRNSPNSNYPNLISQTNGSLSCDVKEEGLNQIYTINTLKKNVEYHYFELYYGEYGQYGFNSFTSEITYYDNRPDTFILYNFKELYTEYAPFRYKLFKFNYSGNTLSSITGVDSMYMEYTNQYTKNITYSFQYLNSRANPVLEIGFDINDIVIEKMFLMPPNPMFHKFILQGLCTFNTQSGYLIEHIHVNDYNIDPYDISDKPMDMDITYVFDDNIPDRVASFKIVLQHNNTTTATRYKILYE